MGMILVMYVASIIMTMVVMIETLSFDGSWEATRTCKNNLHRYSLAISATQTHGVAK